MKIKVKVKPHSRKQEIKQKGEGYIVCLKSLAKDNKANLELVKLLKRYFNVKSVEIKSGFNSRNKILEIK